MLPRRRPLPRLARTPIAHPYGSWQARIMAACLLAALGAEVLAPAPVEAAQPLVYGIESFSARLTLDPSGDFDVVERIRFRVESGGFSSGYRRIPLGRRTGLVGVAVSSPDFQVGDLRERRSGGDLVLDWSFPERTESTTFEIRYRVTGALLEAGGENRIHWEPVGDAWEVPLEAVRITVTWPDFGLTRDEIRLAPEDGGALARADGGWEATFTPGPLGPGESWAMEVTFPRRIEGRAPPPPVDRGALLLGLVMAILGGILPGAVLHRRFRRPEPAGPRGTPSPPAIPIAEGSLLAHGGIHGAGRVFPALLVSLARRGHVILAREEVDGAEPAGAPAGEVLRVRRASAGAGTGGTGGTGGGSSQSSAPSPFEEGFLAELARHDTFGDFMARGAAVHRRTLQELRKRLEAGGWTVDRRRRSSLLVGLGTAAMLTGVAGLFVLVRIHDAPLHVSFPWIVFATLLGAGLVVAGGRRRDLTGRGAEARAEVLSWQAHLRTEIERRLDRDPGGAARMLVDGLEWLLADPRADAAWMQRVEAELRDAGMDIRLPPWIRSMRDPAAGSDDEMLGIFLPLYLLLNPTLTAGQAMPGSGGGGVSMTGVGASGSFGGGGGGIR